VHWFANGEQLVTCSADKTVRCWDLDAGVQIKRLSEHSAIVNSCSPLQRGPQLFVSGGDDSKIKVCLSVWVGGGLAVVAIAHVRGHHALSLRFVLTCAALPLPHLSCAAAVGHAH
jgi:WD40 repeat protein